MNVDGVMQTLLERGLVEQVGRAEVQHLGRDVGGFLWRHAAQDRVDPQEEFLGLEGLGEVVVGPGLEPRDAVGGVALGGEKQDRRRAIGAQAAAEADAVLAGHHHVEHDQVELEPRQDPAGMGGVARGGDQKAVAREKLLEKIADLAK